MKKILIIDTETTGLKPEDGASLIEVGAILFDVELRDVVAQLSFLMLADKNPVEHINRITPELMRSGTSVIYPMSEAFLALAEARPIMRWRIMRSSIRNGLTRLILT